jgi:hypothetical protein
MNKSTLYLGFIFSLLLIVFLLLITGNLSLPSIMEIYGCEEMFSWYYVDPDVARKIVPPEWDPKIHESGKALLLVMVQECDKMVLDKIINLGPVDMSHIWVELEGPEEFLDPYPDTSRSLPTRYWYIYPHQLGSKIAHRLFGLAGVDSQYVDSISLGGDPGGSRNGFVSEIPDLDIQYSWTEQSELYSEPDIVTGSQEFYRKYRNRKSSAQAKCISHFLGDSVVDLNAGTGSAIFNLGFGSILNGYSNPVWVEYCRVHYQVDFFASTTNSIK